jgi:hypothetical protein
MKMKNSIQLSLVWSLFIAINANAQITKTVAGFNHIESVATDGRFIYAADIGKELSPTAKDGDGQIIKLDQKGKILESFFVKEKLNAPKGLAINKGVLYLNDVDRLVAIDLKNGKKLYEIDFGKETSFLNDIAIWDNTTLYVSATDKSKLFKVNLNNKSYSEIKTDKWIPGLNGLLCDKKTSRIYVNGFGTDSKPNGVVGYINLKDNTFTQLSKTEGYFDGISINKGILYVSNWVAFEKKGNIVALDLFKNKASRIINTEPLAGPADFIIVNNQLIVPGMISGELHFISLNTDL